MSINEQFSELISVIVPVYNTEPYIDRCVGSIVDQTYRELEIILIDDGSPDNCPEICDRWADKDPRIVVIHQENRGISAARNAGIERAKGAYFAFVDSDDLLDPEYVEYLYRTLKETGADLAECRYSRFTDDPVKTLAGKELAQPLIQTAEDALKIWSRPEKYPYYNLVVWEKLYRRDLIGEERFIKGFNGGEDVLFTCRIFGKSSKIACIGNELYNWRNTPDSESKRFPDNKLRSVELLFPALDYLAQNYPHFATQCKIHMCSMIRNFVYRLKYKSNVENKGEAKAKMLSFRKRIRFSLKELAGCSLKDRLIILCSKPSLVGLYVRCRHLFDRKR